MNNPDHKFHSGVLLDLPPYSLEREEKAVLLDSRLADLCRYHYRNCEPFRNIINTIGFDTSCSYHYEEIPFLPVRLFKLFDLVSVPKEQIVKTINSSGTTGQAVSKIYLDRETSANQTRALARIITSFIGKQRLPMIIADSENVLKERNLFSARGAGIMGFSLFGTTRMFALDNQMQPKTDQLLAFAEKFKGKKILLFGFTFVIYKHLLEPLQANKIKLDLSGGLLVHGGGWKKLSGESVSSSEFKKLIHETLGITSVHDYYGMAEQTGSIFMECEEGYFHAPVYADVIIRRAKDFSIASHGEKGIIQVLSALPGSYPGHSLLTEDEGYIVGEDDCPCGRKGKYFKITGRLHNAETRGCSDTYTIADE